MKSAKCNFFVKVIKKSLTFRLWGNGVDRTNRLKAAGYDPSVIQNRVNQLLK